MATGFVGQIEDGSSRQGGGFTTPTLSYTAPSSISYAVVQISESVSISASHYSNDISGYIIGFSVVSSFASDNSLDERNLSTSSNDTRVIVGPGESVTIQAQGYTNNTRQDMVFAYTGSMSVLEVS